MAYNETCMHEFVMSLEGMKHKNGVTAMDIAKALLDYGIHPPTMYFPLIVHEALMVEPTETESKETLDEAIQVFHKIYETAMASPEELHSAPHTTKKSTATVRNRTLFQSMDANHARGPPSERRRLTACEEACRVVRLRAPRYAIET